MSETAFFYVLSSIWIVICALTSWQFYKKGKNQGKIEILDRNVKRQDEAIKSWPVYNSLNFDLSTDEGERRLRECLDAPRVSQAVKDFERWLRDRLALLTSPHGDEGFAEADCIREKLFACFTDNDVIVPGWE